MVDAHEANEPMNFHTSTTLTDIYRLDITYFSQILQNNIFIIIYEIFPKFIHLCVLLI